MKKNIHIGQLSIQSCLRRVITKKDSKHVPTSQNLNIPPYKTESPAKGLFIITQIDTGQTDRNKTPKSNSPVYSDLYPIYFCPP